MPKKYRQTRKDREDESRGMERYERSRKRGREAYGEDFVTGHDPMIGRDSHAGLPNRVVMEDYPPVRMRRGGMLDDSMTGIDEIQSQGVSYADSHRSNQK